MKFLVRNLAVSVRLQRIPQMSVRGGGREARRPAAATPGPILYYIPYDAILTLALPPMELKKANPNFSPCVITEDVLRTFAR